MTIRNLDQALEPRSIAVIGAPQGPGSAGAAVLRNLEASGFAGPVWRVGGEGAPFAAVADLPQAPDLAVILAPGPEVPALIAALGARGGRIALVMSEGVTAKNGLRQAMLDAARPHLLRVIGPSTAGLILPWSSLNLSIAHEGPAPGQLALLSQSGMIASALVDWAVARGIGFSQVATLGDMADVDVGDYLDLLAGDGRTRAILIYLESIPSARKFLSAARAAARLKPVIVLKAGRSEEAALAAATHSGALSAADAVVEAALRRAGTLRVRGLSEMFEAAETVARFRPMLRARLGIVSNSGAAGVLGVDRLNEGGGALAALGPETIAALGALLPAGWSGANPVNILGDAPAERYVAAVEAVASDRGVDALLVMNCPTGIADSSAAAEGLAGLVRKGMVGTKPVLSCWLGGSAASSARGILRGAGVASYDNPGTAAAAVGHLTNWGRAQAALLRVPDRSVEEALAATPADARERAAAIFARVAAAGRAVLSEPEAKAVLAAYGVPVPDLRVAASPGAVRAVASEMLADGQRLVVKVLSHEVSHKSDIGGVVLGLASAEEAGLAAEGIARRFRAALPEAELEGFALQPMVERSQAQELILGMARDPIFGPVILFGAGGIAVEVTRDTAIALPPLDSGLAADLIGHTRVGALLAGYRGRPAADQAAIVGALMALSHMIEDFPCLRSLDVNPLLADAEGVLALDARIEIDPADLGRKGPNPDMAIRPYPGGWRRELVLKGEPYTLRPILPADANLYPAFFEKVSAEHIRMRFLAPRRGFGEADAVRWSQLDYDREIAFIAVNAAGEMAGVSRMSADPDHRSAEYSLLIRSDLNGRGLGHVLMGILIDYARADGIERLEGMVLADNSGMHRLIGSLGFRHEAMPDEPGVVMTYLDLV
ncbi:MAG: bifunctional acetate--CoA ligase family protein/GNAT family N-acetyltransferase [Amaricoccus sp.]